MRKENSELIFKLSIPTFILLGFAKITSYYNQFHLPILEYLNFSEMITIFLGNIYVYSALFMQFAIFFFLNHKHFRGSVTLIFLAFGLITLFNGLSGDFRFHNVAYIPEVIAIIVAVCAIVIKISMSSVITYLSSLDKTNIKFLTAGFTILILLVISGFQGKFEANEVKKNHIYAGTTIINKNDTLNSNDKTYFIGKTNDYIFFYNEKDEDVKIYPIKEISAITYKTKAMQPW